MSEYSDNVVCTLKVGDKVQIHDWWGPKLGGKKGVVLSVERHRNCESGFMVKTNITDHLLDANWFKKL